MIRRFAEARDRRFGLATHIGRYRDGLAQSAEKSRKALTRPAVSVRAPRLRIHDQRKLARQVVHDRELFRHEQEYVGHTERIRFLRAAQPLLDVADRLVREVADQPAAKARQPRIFGYAKALQILFDEGKRILGRGALYDRVTLDLHAFVAADLDAAMRGKADERIAAETLASDHGLEQIRMRLVRELQIQRKRRVEIRERLEDDRHAVIAGLRERVEFAFGHAFSMRSTASSSELRSASVSSVRMSWPSL